MPGRVRPPTPGRGLTGAEPAAAVLADLELLGWPATILAARLRTSAATVATVRGGTDHRHFLICRRCGHSLAVDSEPVESWADEVVAQSGFVDVQYTVELAGICAGCAPAPPDRP
ncbi:hypothetical protein [Kitasatospora sp. NPDC059571]|uniref:hypothetical protein n=1 Tax=Kitasatospora sp. NPDC059571 TaxID=3346871 RepID=UPI0036B950BB